MKKVWIEPGCISCGSCQYRAPEVFMVTTSSEVLPHADLKKNCALIKNAAQACPVNVIHYEE